MIGVMAFMVFAMMIVGLLLMAIAGCVIELICSRKSKRRCGTRSEMRGGRDEKRTRKGMPRNLRALPVAGDARGMRRLPRQNGVRLHKRTQL